MSIEDFNLWWRGRKYAEEDPDIVKWREMPVRWVPAEIEEIALEPFSLNFLYGPRQVGKTTLVKLLVLRLLERVEPEAVFYFSCDLLSDYEELLEVLREYLRVRRPGQPSYIFLDEVTFVREWYRAVKHLIDTGRLRSVVVTITGSSSLWVERAAETFPGRRGKGRDVLLRPLGFSAYARVHQPDIVAKPGWYGRLDELFESYLATGGFPLPINSRARFGRITPDVYKSYVDWLVYDLKRANRDERLAKALLSALLERAGGRLSYSSLARDLGVSHRTVSEYVDLLSRMHLALVLNYVDVFKGVKDFRKMVKVHFTDPFLYDVVARWTGAGKLEVSAVVEGVVASHLSRKFEVGYTVVGRREVDVVALPEMAGYEVKYGRRAAPPLSAGKMKKVVVLSKTGVEGATPIPLFLFTL